MGHGGRIPWIRLILGGTLGLAIAVALGVLIGPLIFMQVKGGGSYRISDDSMAPNLLAGDWVLGEALFPGRAPPRGTIVVYEHPRDRGRDALMRVVGLPGERIQMRGGALYINGQRATMERLDDRVVKHRPSVRRANMPLCINREVEVDGPCHQEQWRETLADGTSAVVLNTKHKVGVAVPSGRGSTDDTKIFRVPSDMVFVLGDNRDAAIDSRSPAHGMVPVHKLKYRVSMIHTSLDLSARFFTPRWERFFQEVE